MRPLYSIFIIFIACNYACGSKVSSLSLPADHAHKEILLTDTLFDHRPEFFAECFIFPVGPPKAKGYYNAQGFGKNTHLGDDWNGTGMGNTDLGDPVYAVANGYVISAVHEGPGWGNVIRIIHQWKNGSDTTWTESLYAHLDTMLVSEGNYILQKQQLGTIGTADGAYYAHLHLEIRDSLWMPLGGGYSKNTDGYLDPTIFIRTHACK